MNLDDYAKEIHEANKRWWECLHCKNGFKHVFAQRVTGDTTPLLVSVTCQYCVGTHDSAYNDESFIVKLALMHSELSEALEGMRKGLLDDKLPQYPMWQVEYVDAVIRILDALAARGAPVEEIFRAKMEFNAKRADHKLENRLKEGGKRF